MCMCVDNRGAGRGGGAAASKSKKVKYSMRKVRESKRKEKSGDPKDPKGGASHRARCLPFGPKIKYNRRRGITGKQKTEPPLCAFQTRIGVADSQLRCARVLVKSAMRPTWVSPLKWGKWEALCSFDVWR